VITSAAAFSVPENTTAVTTVTATDADLPPQTVSFSITGGADAATFSITSAGVLTFEGTSTRVNSSHVAAAYAFDCMFTPTDSGFPALFSPQSITARFPSTTLFRSVITSAAAFSVPENTTAVTTVTATDADLPPQTVSFSITGGADAATFSITSAGVLT